jgi:hypothetical protein
MLSRRNYFTEERYTAYASLEAYVDGLRTGITLLSGKSVEGCTG